MQLKLRKIVFSFIGTKIQIPRHYAERVGKIYLLIICSRLLILYIQSKTKDK
jgi:hypothetical protein